MNSLMHRAILRLAGYLVPVEQRSEWLEEWHSELWYVRKCFYPGRKFRETPTGFCIGAFPDALCMRSHA